uniref:Putative conserved plasma membrane protein n=1 Tax=Lutzomyia longipalpis TaxID=7200 RepID=A0A1B0CK29_LUTLO
MDFFVKIKKPFNPDEEETNSDENILKWQYDIISRWKNTTETLFLTKGPPSLGILGALSGIYIHNHYRTKLKLGSYGRATSYLPIVVLPALVAPLVHKMVVQTRILLSDYDCPVCLEVRGGLVHTSLAVIYPGLLAPLASFMYANRHFTYRIPSVTESPREVFKLWAKLTRPIATPLIGLLLANYFAAMYVTYAQIRDFHTIMMTVDKQISRLEEKL